MKSSVLITGAAGFIGSSLSQRLIDQNYTVIGIDNFKDSVSKRNKIKKLSTHKKFKFLPIDIRDAKKLNEIFSKNIFNNVVHLAALTGVRASLLHPDHYIDVNINGTDIVYRTAQKYNIASFIFSSSSSVYGNSRRIPFVEKQRLSPESPYAKTKYAAEILIKKLYRKKTLPTTILRFFSVYGPGGRSDMAPYLFTDAAFTKKIVTQYGDGTSARDYTYIDDVLSAIQKTLVLKSNWSIINIGNSTPVKLKTLIATVEKYTQKKILIKQVPLNNAESFITYADISQAKKLLSWSPQTKFEKGMQNFIEWFKMHQL